ncbi:carboxyl transferase domain-containing protein [Streptomyces sp. NPDC008150]|uniref:carboxyl transferase domain-containing protein n=1 Tax=Streptomyces sp. NPDC008150 TaxID=3364816 RepID=UPI0036E08DB9
MGRRSAAELIELVLDDDSFESWDEPVDTGAHPEEYRSRLAAAAERSGADESVLTGRGLVRGRPVAVVVNEFQFLGGSIGVAAAARITRAVRRATAAGLPLLASTATGGTRMQEGTPAFVKMVDISRALMDHRAAGLPYLVHLGDPTTGGVFASWGSLGHVTVGEPGARIGFLGPKVYEALHGEPFPAGVQAAENLAAHGVLDAVVPTEDLSALTDRVLRVLVDGPDRPSLPRRTGRPLAERDAWASVTATRAPDRIGVRDLLLHGGDSTVPLAASVEGERDDAVLVALTRLDGLPCVVVGQDRSREGARSPLGPAALRKARRAMALAGELRLPLVTVIDTAGADLSVEAEQGALSGEIARCVAALATLTVPTVSVLLGQGTGGGALALLPARTVVAAERAWLSPLPPEGASTIVHGSTEHAAAMARRQHVRAVDLLADGVVHAVVPERAGDTVADLARAVVAEVAACLSSNTPEDRVS